MDLRNIILELISEGENVRERAEYKGKYYTTYSGEEYEKWINKGLHIMESNFKETEWFKRFLDASKRAVGNDICAYNTMIGILKAIAESDNIEEINIIERKKDKKIFISHCSRNRTITDEFVNLLKSCGFSNNQIYYSSYEENGAEYLESCLDSIRREFEENELIVLFMLSREFYESNVCLAEMGATWVNNVKYIPIVVPPLEYADIKGVVNPMQNSIMLLDSDAETKFDKLLCNLQEFLQIQNNPVSSEWTRIKNSFLKKVQNYAQTIIPVDSKISSIKILDDQVVLKIKLKNITNNRYEFEGINISLNMKNGTKFEKYIDDWSIKSIVLQPAEEINFYISFNNEKNLKVSQINTNISEVRTEYYTAE